MLFKYMARALLALPLLTATALAGHWTVSYSGGIGTIPGGGSNPYTKNSGAYGGGGTGASGQITATFTWTADSLTDISIPANPTVYVWESCTASANSYAGSASADCGLSDGGICSKSSSNYGPANMFQAVTSQGTRLTEHSTSSLSFTVKATPTASGQFSASVSYSAATISNGISIHRSDGGQENLVDGVWQGVSIYSWFGFDSLGYSYLNPGTTSLSATATVSGTMSLNAAGKWSGVQPPADASFYIQMLQTQFPVGSFSFRVG